MNAERAMTLRELLPVLAVHQRQVRIARHRPSHGVDDLSLPRCVRQVIVATDHVRHAHIVIVDDDRKHVGRRPV